MRAPKVFHSKLILVMKNQLGVTYSPFLLSFHKFGAIAQLVEHLHGMQGVSGSSPLGSIKIKLIRSGFQGNKIRSELIWSYL